MAGGPVRFTCINGPKRRAGPSSRMPFAYLAVRDPTVDSADGSRTDRVFSLFYVIDAASTGSRARIWRIWTGVSTLRPYVVVDLGL